jgi:hypothetical protein
MCLDTTFYDKTMGISGQLRFLGSLLLYPSNFAYFNRCWLLDRQVRFLLVDIIRAYDPRTTG